MYVIGLTDVLSLKSVGLHFERGYVQHMRDKRLLSILLGKIAHFPVEGTSHFIVVWIGSFRNGTHLHCTNLQVSYAHNVAVAAPVRIAANEWDGS